MHNLAISSSRRIIINSLGGGETKNKQINDKSEFLSEKIVTFF